MNFRTLLFFAQETASARVLEPGVIKAREVFREPGFIGFAGIGEAKFRSMVEPGQDLYLLGQIIKYKKRGRRTHVETRVQGVVNGTMAFEAVVAGMRVI